MKSSVEKLSATRTKLTIEVPFEELKPEFDKAYATLAQQVNMPGFRKGKVPVTIFLMNGVKLQGVITWFDNFCVLLRRDGQSQLVYKHAISTVMPSQPITLYEAEDH